MNQNLHVNKTNFSYWKVLKVHWTSLWNRGERQLGDHLLSMHSKKTQHYWLVMWLPWSNQQPAVHLQFTDWWMILHVWADELLLSCAGGTGKRLLKDFKNRHHMYVSPNFSCSKHWFRKTSDEAVRHSLFVPLIMLSPGRRNNHLVKKMLAPYHF